MKVALQNIIAGKIDEKGQTTQISSITSKGAELNLSDGKKKVRVNLTANVDFDALEFVLKFDDLTGATIHEPTFDLDDSEFDLLSRDDTFKNEYWFSITEKNPGAHDMIGAYSVLVIELERLYGDIHIYITIE